MYGVRVAVGIWRAMRTYALLSPRRCAMTDIHRIQIDHTAPPGVANPTYLAGRLATCILSIALNYNDADSAVGPVQANR